MVRRHLSEDLKQAGLQVLSATDELGMQAQAAMWVYNHALQDWRYYLVTSLVDTIGRRKTYRLLLEIFERIDLPKEMTIEDVYLGSPSDPFFKVVSQLVHVDSARLEFQNCKFNDIMFDGIIFRSLREIPSDKQAAQIEKKFSRKVKDLVASRGR
jgi:hypothetical protein